MGVRLLQLDSNRYTALELIRCHGRDGYYPLDETVPVDDGVTGDWADLAYRHDSKERRRVVRTVYEIATSRFGSRTGGSGCRSTR